MIATAPPTGGGATRAPEEDTDIDDGAARDAVATRAPKDTANDDAVIGNATKSLTKT